MKRFHVHVAVDQLEESIRFYSALFGHAPTVARTDYAKWMLEDPRINFAISRRGHAVGVNHIGFQVESAGELADMRTRLEAAGSEIADQVDITCCYARGDKHWVTDPSGVAWETFHTLGEAVVYGEDGREPTSAANAAPQASACCAPAQVQQPATRRGCCT